MRLRGEIGWRLGGLLVAAAALCGGGCKGTAGTPADAHATEPVRDASSTADVSDASDAADALDASDATDASDASDATDAADGAGGDARDAADARPDADAGQPTDAVAPTDAPQPTDAQPDVPHGVVPMFVAAGGRFRRLISCDDGKTWVADQVDTSSMPDEATGTRGLAYGGGLFVAATGGGGKTGRIYTTADGMTWTERVPTGTYNGFSQTAYGNGLYVAGGGNISIRSASGTSGWGELSSMGDGGILREMVFGGGTFVAVGGGRIVHSTDALTWTANASGSCGNEVLGLAFGNGRFLGVSSTGATCLSTNGGVDWSSGNIGGTDPVAVVWTGHDFLVRGGGHVYRSTDGVSWTSTVATGAGPIIMAASDHNTFAGVEGTKFYRSTDGVSWTAVSVPAGSGQNLSRIVFGYGNPSTVCPSP